METTKENVVKVYPIPLFKDNFSYMVIYDPDNKGILIDPAEP